jgi:hypothetical protein
VDPTLLAPAANLTAAGLLAGVVAWLLRAIARGDWVSRRELDYVRADRDARLAASAAETAEWRAVAATERAAREVATDQSRTLLESVRTLDRFYDALRAVAEGDDHVDPHP